jgi:class 3 adenylate cyclase
MARVGAHSTEMASVLITDLVGSTTLADGLSPDGAEQLRREQFALLRGAVASEGGREVKNLGDGLMIVFKSAARSLSRAVAMQQAVEARNRCAEYPLEVLVAHGRPTDHARALPMLELAEQAAGKLGAAPVTRDVANTRHALAQTAR